MICTSAIVELRRRSAAGILAVPYRGGRPGRARRLPDGAIVEVAEPDRRREAPARPSDYLGLAADGGPATAHHANLGLIAGFLLLEGVFLLPSGEVAAVYGAESSPIG